MPGRNFSSEKYRCSINGQEKTPEIATNTTTAEFWQYDARIGRRWNVDPRPNIAISPYNCFVGNPIWFSDIMGDTLSVAKNANSENDINSIVSRDNQGFIDFNGKNNTTTLKESIDINGKTVSLKDAMSKDEGLRLLYDLISDTKSYSYSVSNLRSYNIIDMSNNNVVQGLNNDNSIGVAYPVGSRMDATPSRLNPNDPDSKSYYETFSNLSFTVRGDEQTINGVSYQIVPNKTYRINSYTRRYDGTVTISPGQFFQERTVNGVAMLTPIRHKVVFHELQENYFRVNGMQYTPAHEEAINVFKSPYGSGKPSGMRRFESGADQTNGPWGDSYYFIMGK